MRRNGPDGDRIGLATLDTNPVSSVNGIGFDIGANRENGGSNNATRMWRLSIRLRDATPTAGGRAVMKHGSSC
jgi:hypothetical protein